MKSLRAALFVTVASMSLAGGCASANGGQSGRGTGAQLTQSDLAAANSDNVYDAIMKLRPEWLSSRGPTSATNSTPTSVDIYMNGTFLGKAGGERITEVQLKRGDVLVLADNAATFVYQI